MGLQDLIAQARTSSFKIDWLTSPCQLQAGLTSFASDKCACMACVQDFVGTDSEGQKANLEASQRL